MVYKPVVNLCVVLLALGIHEGVIADHDKPPKTYEATRKLLSAMKSPLLDRNKLAALFRIGDGRIGDLVRALDDPDQEISSRAQLVIRYLGNEVGMTALMEWYGKHNQFSVVGPIPLPLREWDYKVINANYIGKPPETWYLAEPYIYALALDGSPRAKSLLNEIIKSARELDESTIVGRAIKQVQANNPAELLTGYKNLDKLVLDNAFFVVPEDRKYTSAHVLGFNAARDKVLIEVYINRGTLSEEWYHVVIRRCEQGWKFFFVAPVAVS